MNPEGLLENSGGRGLPEKLPQGERVLWQASPCWKTMFRHVFHARFVAAYFAAIIAWITFSSLSAGAPVAGVALTASKLIAVALVPVGLSALYCWGVQRSTIYTITNKRVVMSFGMALPMSVNLPFSRIASAGLKHHTAEAGDIPLQLMAGERMALFMVWPHARPWHFARPEPMLRCIPRVDEAAGVLARALAVDAAMPVPYQPAMPSRKDLAPALHGQAAHA
jgi:hypothetical protein